MPKNVMATYQELAGSWKRGCWAIFCRICCGAKMEGPEEIEEGTDLYGLLGVKKTAPKNEIRKAYRKLARTFHPDHHGGDVRDEAEKKFVQINYAYVVLMDDEQRAVYDIYGLEALKSNTCKELVKRYPTLDEVCGRSPLS